MSDPTLAPPLRYDPSYEKPEEDEAQTTAEMIEVFLKMAGTMADHTGHAMRAVHAKAHGLLSGELRVLDGLPEQFAQGIFAVPRGYPVLLRLSSPPAEQLPDDVSLPRALSLKIIGVEGERLPGSEGQATQDFLMVNGPAFSRPDAKGFLKDVKLIATTTDKSPHGKQILSALLRGTEKVIEALGGESAKIKSMGGHPETHPLGETYFTQTPFLYGTYMAKLSVAPVSPALVALKDAALDMKDKPDAMREAVSAFFTGAQVARWEVRIQLCTDIEKMPLEDSSVPWPETDSPYVTVAHITVPAQTAWTTQREREVDDGMSFSPWHGIAAHRPLGSVMRVRKAVYEASAGFRSQRNGCPLHEPRAEVFTDASST